MKDLLENGRLAWRLLNDQRVPTWIKVAIPLIVFLYFFSPIDVIPDFLLGAGQLDDLGVLLLGMSLIVRFSPQEIVNEHRSAMGLEARGSAGFRAGDSKQPRSTWVPPTAPSSGAPTTPMAQGEGRSIEGEYRIIPPE